MRALLCLLVICWPTLSLFAQTGKASVKGFLIEATTDNPVAFGSAVLYNADDQEQVTGALTDEKGFFQITDIAFGQYYLTFQYLSFAPLQTRVFELSQDSLVFDAGKVKLKTAVEEIEGVEITAERSQVEMALDKRVYNVGQDVTSTGGSAEEVLNNVPSVVVDVEGNISLRGSGNVRILIDGKPSGLIGTGSGSGLRQIPASMIERIEVITNPSARYDAEGEAGIINIILKKEEKMGFNGSFEVNAGLPERLGAAANMNFRRRHFNLFLNYGLNYQNNPGYGFTEQTFSYEDTTFYTNVDRNHTRGGVANSVQMGSDFFWGKNNMLTGSFLYKYSDQTNISTLTYNDFDQNFDLQRLTRRVDNERELESDLEWSLNCEKKFDGDDHKLTADIRYVLSQESEDSDIDQFTDFQSTPDLQTVLNEEYERNIIGNIDYIRKFREKGVFETGWRSTLRNINNPFIVEDWVDGKWVAQTNFTNSLFYTENVHAAYAIVGNELDKFSYQLGLRSEYTHIDTYLEETDERYPRDYLNLFPSVHLTYKKSLTNSFQVSYSRRINRPSFWNLNPFYSFTDPRNFRAGNPNLNPEFTHSVEAGHMYFWKSGSLLSSVYYRHTDNVIQRVTQTFDDGTTLSLPINLSVRRSLGLEFNYSHKLSRGVRFMANANFFRQEQEGVFEDLVLTNTAYSVSGRASAQWKLFKKINAQTSLNYRGPQTRPQGFVRARWFMNLGFSQDFLDGNATWSVSARDLFNTRKRMGWTETETYYAYSEFQWRARTVVATFTYRINQKKRRGPVLGRDGGGGE